MKGYSDIQLIEDHLTNLKASLDPSKRWWPETLFHFTDINNAVRILECDKLYSRNYLLQSGGMVNDNASPEIIGLTNDQWKDYVRFYFRPRTPTQYHNEGFRPKAQRVLGGAHCPLPIFFLFESLPILSMKESMFSTGNLASNHPVYTTGKQFVNLPFDYIYHEGAFTQDQRFITGHRQAEVIIPESCGLDHLKLIVCRSAAERETLIELLSVETLQKYHSKIVVDTRLNLFNCDWKYVERVALSKEKIEFTFNVGSRVNYPYEASLEIIEKKTGIVYYWADLQFKNYSQYGFTLSNLKRPEEYTVKFYLEKDLAYQNSFNDDLLLF